MKLRLAVVHLVSRKCSTYVRQAPLGQVCGMSGSKGILIAGLSRLKPNVGLNYGAN